MKSEKKLIVAMCTARAMRKLFQQNPSSKNLFMTYNNEFYCLSFQHSALLSSRSTRVLFRALHLIQNSSLLQP